MAHRLAHPFDLVLAPLVDRQLDPAAAELPDARRRRRPVVQLDPLLEAAEGRRGWIALDVHLVDLVNPVARVREPVSKLPVVRQHERAGRIGVEPSDRNDAGLGRDEPDHRRPPLGVARGGDDAGRLVQQQVREALLADRAAVDLDRVAGTDERVQLARLSVDPDTAGFDQLVGRAAGGDPGAGEVGVQPHLRILMELIAASQPDFTVLSGGGSSMPLDLPTERSTP